MLTRARAARARCLDCAGSAAQVRGCPLSDCPLWRFRFGIRPSTARARGLEVGEGDNVLSRAIRRYCTWCSGESAREVPHCPDTRCPLWPYRMAKPAERPRPVENPPAHARLGRELRRVGTLTYLAEVGAKSGPWGADFGASARQEGEG